MDEALSYRNFEPSKTSSKMFPPMASGKINKKDHPNVTQDSTDIFNDVDFIKTLMNALFEGLGLNSLLGNEDVCFDTVELLLWHSYYTYTGYFETGHIWNATISLTFVLSEVSPVVRNCYSFSE